MKQKEIKGIVKDELYNQMTAIMGGEGFGLASEEAGESNLADELQSEIMKQCKRVQKFLVGFSE